MRDHRPKHGAPLSAVERVRTAYAAITAVDRPEIWIFLRPIDDVLTEAVAVDAALAAGQDLPLAGLVAAVKNNIDIAGLPTTAACPAYATAPAVADAPVVARLRAAGAVVLGATNLDQFATGLVGTRSPFGAVRDARRLEHISGGSSSGSAVAVALGLADIGVGTDTAGSGRVPAALQGIVGIKPTPGLVLNDGVVPACRSYDCVTVMARDIDTADVAMGVMAGRARPFPPDAPLAAPPNATVAIPRELPGLSEPWRSAFRDACDRLVKHAVSLREIDLVPFLEAARLLYDGGLVAERHEAVGTFVDAHRTEVDPTVGAIVSAAGEIRATDLLADRVRLAELTATALAEMSGSDALLVPTTTSHPTIAEVQADPFAVNSALGVYTSFCNLMDLCAVAVPAGTADGSQFGVTVVARSGADAVALDLARLVVVPTEPVARPGAVSLHDKAPEAAWPVRAGLAATPLFVVDAHPRDQLLAHRLTERGARWMGPAVTAPLYRLARFNTAPAEQGMVRVGTETGEPIRGELWLVGTAMLGDFLAALPIPMTLGPLVLSTGDHVLGFSQYGGWGLADT